MTTIARLQALALLISASVVAQEAPRLLSFEGRLLRADGTPEGGQITLTFRLYTLASGGADAWSESHVLLLGGGGYYAVYLGATNPLPAFDGANYWLGVTVVGEAEMTPRTRLASVAYALRATSAARADDAAKLGGDAATEFLQRSSSLDASRLSGTVDAARLPLDVPLLSTAQLSGLSSAARGVALLGGDGKIDAQYMPSGGSGVTVSPRGAPFDCNTDRVGALYFDAYSDLFFGCRSSSWRALQWSGSAPIVAQGLLGYWTFDNHLLDSNPSSPGRVNAVVLNGTPTFVLGANVRGSAVYFNGSTLLNLGSTTTPSDVRPTADFTIDFWARAASGDPGQRIFGLSQHAGGIHVFFNVGQLYGSLNTGTATELTYTPTENLQSFHNVVFRYSSSEGKAKLYLNKVLKVIANTSGNLVYSATPYNALGADERNILNFAGAVDNLKIYSRALTDGAVTTVGGVATGEVAQNYAAEGGP